VAAPGWCADAAAVYGAVVVAFGAFVLAPEMKRVRRVRRGLCGRCGYDLRRTLERCLECGDTAAASPSLNQRAEGTPLAPRLAGDVHHNQLVSDVVVAAAATGVILWRVDKEEIHATRALPVGQFSDPKRHPRRQRAIMDDARAA
jgi:hypothetical protein